MKYGAGDFFFLFSPLYSGGGKLCSVTSDPHEPLTFNQCWQAGMSSCVDSREVICQNSVFQISYIQLTSAKIAKNTFENGRVNLVPLCCWKLLRFFSFMQIWIWHRETVCPRDDGLHFPDIPSGITSLRRQLNIYSFCLVYSLFLLMLVCTASSLGPLWTLLCASVSGCGQWWFSML